MAGPYFLPLDRVGPVMTLANETPVREPRRRLEVPRRMDRVEKNEEYSLDVEYEFCIIYLRW
jgi:hypothetical protein